MDPISVHGAKEDRPFTMKVDGNTIRDLHAALTALIAMGYGGTAICRADIEAGPLNVTGLELYDTSKEVERGELLEKMTFLLC